LQEAEHDHELMQHVVVDLLAFVNCDVLRLIVVRGEEAVPQRWDIVELLDHGVHVAHGSEVFDSTIAVPGSSS
jgi:hypothetical protein